MYHIIPLSCKGKYIVSFKILQKLLKTIHEWSIMNVSSFHCSFMGGYLLFLHFQIADNTFRNMLSHKSLCVGCRERTRSIIWFCLGSARERKEFKSVTVLSALLQLVDAHLSPRSAPW